MPELDSATIEQVATEFFRGRATISELAEPYTIDELIRAYEGLRRSMVRLLTGLTEDQINFNPDPATYSLSEVVSHMVAAQGNAYNAFIDLTHSSLPHVDPVPRDPGGGAQKGLTATELQTQLQKATDDLVQVIRLTYDPAVKSVIAMGQFGKLSYKGFMVYQLYHDLDHLKQSQSLRRAPNFPARQKLET